MTVKFACPKCQQAIRVAAEMAGKVAACPGCGVKLRIPAPRPVRAGGRPTAARPQAPPTPAPATNLPFDDDDWDAALQPAGSQAEASKTKPVHNYGRPSGGSTRNQLRWVRRGLWVIYFSMLLGVLGTAIERSMWRVADAESQTPLYLWLLGLTSVIAKVGVASGVVLCMAVPSRTGLQVKAQAAMVLQALYATLAAALLLRRDAMSDTEAEFLSVFTVLAMAGSYFGFLEYAKGLAKLQNRPDLVVAGQTLTLLGVILFAVVVAAPFAVLAIAQADSFEWLIMPLRLASAAAWIGSIYAFWMYAGVVKDLAKELS